MEKKASKSLFPKENPQTIKIIGAVNLGEIVGKGASGVVRFASTSDKKRVFAVKLMKRSGDLKTQLYSIREAYITR
jgi:hypothetical protein